MSEWEKYIVFISSTFKDMQDERDYLSSVVFPELEEKLRTSRINLEYVDLRWGVSTSPTKTELLKNIEIIENCFDRIDQENVIFIALLGERYGWIPSQQVINGLNKKGYSIEYSGKSITEMELEYASSTNKVLEYFFYFRNNIKFNNLLSDQTVDFIPQSPEEVKNSLKLSKFKDKIKKNYPTKVYNYEYNLSDIKTKRESLRHLGKKVTMAILNKIKVKKSTTDYDWKQLEAEANNEFVEWNIKNTLIRNEFVSNLIEKYSENQMNTHQFTLLSGEAGIGKSIIYSHLVSFFSKKKDNLLLINSAGASPYSSDLNKVLQRWIFHLTQILNLKYDSSGEKKYVVEDKVEEFYSLLNLLPKQKKVLLLFDGINQMNDHYSLKYLTWLPDIIPNNVFFIGTTNLNFINPSVFNYKDLVELRIPFLTLSDARKMLTESCKQYHKSLSKSLIQAAFEKKGVYEEKLYRNPLKITLLVEYLIFLSKEDFHYFYKTESKRGVKFEKFLRDKILGFPKETNDMYKVLFERYDKFCKQLNIPWLKKFLQLLAISRSGLRETDIDNLASSNDKDFKLNFQIVRRLLRFHLNKPEINIYWNLKHTQCQEFLMTQITPKKQFELYQSISFYISNISIADNFRREEAIYYHFFGNQPKLAFNYLQKIKSEVDETGQIIKKLYIVGSPGHTLISNFLNTKERQNKCLHWLKEIFELAFDESDSPILFIQNNLFEIERHLVSKNHEVQKKLYSMVEGLIENQSFEVNEEKIAFNYLQSVREKLSKIYTSESSLELALHKNLKIIDDYKRRGTLTSGDGNLVNPTHTALFHITLSTAHLYKELNQKEEATTLILENIKRINFYKKKLIRSKKKEGIDLEIDIELEPLYKVLAKLFFEAELYDESLKYAEICLKYAVFRKEKYKEKVIQIFGPKCFDIYLQIGQIYLHMDKTELAESFLRKWVHLIFYSYQGFPKNEEIGRTLINTCVKILQLLEVKNQKNDKDYQYFLNLIYQQANLLRKLYPNHSQYHQILNSMKRENNT